MTPSPLTRRALVLGGAAALAGCSFGSGAPTPSATGEPTPPTPTPTPRGTDVAVEPAVDWSAAVDGNTLDDVFAGLPRYRRRRRDVVVQPGRYERATALKPPDGVRLVALGSTFVGHAPGMDGAVIDLTGTRDVTIVGGTWDADRSAYSGPRTEWRHAIKVNDARGIVLQDLEVRGAQGDGIYVGYSSRLSRDVRLLRVTSTDNARNGLSVTACDGFVCEDSTFDLNGFDELEPRAGIDIEPHEPDWRVDDVVIRRCSAARNGGRGLLYADGAGETTGSILVEDCTFTDNLLNHPNPVYGGIHLRRPRDLTVNRCVVTGALIGLLVEGGGGGRAEFNDCRFADNATEGVLMNTGDTTLTLNRTEIVDNSQDTAGLASGIFLEAGTLVVRESVIRGPRQRAPLTVTAPTASVTLIACDLAGNIGDEIENVGDVPVTVEP